MTTKLHLGFAATTRVRRSARTQPPQSAHDEAKFIIGRHRAATTKKVKKAGVSLFRVKLDD